MKNELSEDQELKEFDQWMKSLPVQKVGENFTATVIASAILMQKRNRSMRLMFFTIVMLSVVIFLSFFLHPALPVDLPAINVPRLDLSRYTILKGALTSVFMNSKVILFCIVLEAILFLLIIDQIANHYRYIKRNVLKLRV